MLLDYIFRLFVIKWKWWVWPVTLGEELICPSHDQNDTSFIKRIILIDGASVVE